MRRFLIWKKKHGTCNPKMIIVMRKDLNMRKGKMVAQGGHAVLSAYKTANRKDPAFIEWDTKMFKKICVGVDSEKELLDLFVKAKEMGINFSVIVDNGLTEFNGTATLTCSAFGPASAEKLDALTGHLKLL